MTKLIITRRSRHKIISISLAMLIVIVFVVANRGGSEVASNVESELPTDSFELFDGSQAVFADFEGKPLIINFWASWCPACVAELPDIEAVHQQFGDDVNFLGIANADRRDLATKLADEVGLTYDLADDPDGDFFREFELFAMPTTLFITADGQIQKVFGGQLNEKALIERIGELVEAS